MIDAGETQKVFYVVTGLLGIGAVVISGLLIVGIQKFVSTAYELVSGMDRLREDMAEVKSYGPRITKIKKEVDQIHGKLRGLNHLIKEY